LQLLLHDPIGYKSNSQRARIATETWALQNLYCPNCTSLRLQPTRTGFAVTDLQCPICADGYQLKGKRGPIGGKVRDAAYSAAIRAAERNEFPHLVLLSYQAIPGTVVTLQVVPGAFITPIALEAGRPLAPTAKRAGWIGCNIILNDLPKSARIFMVENGLPRQIRFVRAEWRRWRFLRTQDVQTRSWFNEILKRVENLGKDDFPPTEIYAFEDELARLFPRNRFIRPKIRQQLQVLRDRGFLEFRERGQYKYRRNI
jgi:type II restriction enzyme